MKNDEKWQLRYNEVMTFMERHKRRPSKHKEEDLVMVDWIKYNKRRLAQGRMDEVRAEKFKRLLRLGESMTRMNQYGYIEDKRRRRILGIQHIHTEEFTE
jgi:hypothetical protein